MCVNIINTHPMRMTTMWTRTICQRYKLWKTFRVIGVRNQVCMESGVLDTRHSSYQNHLFFIASGCGMCDKMFEIDTKFTEILCHFSDATHTDAFLELLGMQPLNCLSRAETNSKHWFSSLFSHREKICQLVTSTVCRTYSIDEHCSSWRYSWFFILCLKFYCFSF